MILYWTLINVFKNKKKNKTFVLNFMYITINVYSALMHSSKNNGIKTKKNIH